MTTENLGLFKAMSSKMQYLDQRHRLIAQNIANSDTPGYEPRDLKPVDFGAVMENVVKPSALLPETTQAGHMKPGGEVDTPKKADQRQVFEVAPSGNAVILEEQMLKSSENMVDYKLMNTIYKKNVAMIKAAIGNN